MSIFVLVLCVCCYFVANIYQNKFSTTLDGRIYPMNCFQMLWMALAVGGFLVFELLTDGLQFSQTTCFYGIWGGIFSLVGAMCFLGALSCGPLSLTLLIFSMYVVVPPVLAMIFLGETATVCQMIAIFIIVLVLILSNYNKDDLGNRFSKKWWLLGIGSIVGTGVTNYIAKLHQTVLPGQEVREYAIVSYVTGILIAFIFSRIFVRRDMVKHQETYRFTLQYFLIPAIVIAITQGGANLCNLYNASRLPAIILYPVTQLATLMLSTIYGVVVLKEKLSRCMVICLMLGAVAIILMNF